MAPHPGVAVQRAGDRFQTSTSWLDSRHGFSYGAHYDPSNTHFGLLLAHNDDVLRPGHGFDLHPHRDVEILTWVLDGTLVHEDSAGHSGVVTPGTVQHLSAGSGVRHVERSGSAESDVHLVQMWVVPDESGDPTYARQDLTAELRGGALVPVASGIAGVRIRQRHAVLHAARPYAGLVIGMPTAPWVHLFVARGSVDLEDAGGLGTGDSARITASDGHRVTAGPDGAEMLVWEMHATLGQDLA